MTAIAVSPRMDRAVESLRRSGNPFRNYFARNPDDEVCARYHVPELYAAERNLLLNIIDLYRYDPNTHSEVIPVLGNKGAGKTHLLHSIKHGGDGAWQLLVTPGTSNRANARGEMVAASAPRKSRGSPARTSRPGRNFSVAGLGVASVWMNMTESLAGVRAIWNGSKIDLSGDKARVSETSRERVGAQPLNTRR